MSKTGGVKKSQAEESIKPVLKALKQVLRTMQLPTQGHSFDQCCEGG